MYSQSRHESSKELVRKTVQVENLFHVRQCFQNEDETIEVE